MAIWEKSNPNRGSRGCTVTDMNVCSLHWQNSKEASVAGAEQAGGTVVGGECGIRLQSHLVLIPMFRSEYLTLKGMGKSQKKTRHWTQ